MWSNSAEILDALWCYPIRVCAPRQTIPMAAEHSEPGREFTHRLMALRVGICSYLLNKTGSHTC